jgi:hypothetical protein
MKFNIKNKVDINIKLQINGIIKRLFGKHMTADTKSGLRNITTNANLCNDVLQKNNEVK